MSKKKEQKESSKDLLVREAITRFREDYPTCDVTNLTPTYPESLKDVDLTGKAMAVIELNPVIKSTLCGTVFGDSSINIPNGYANARMQFRHSSRQNDWFMWKALCVFNCFTNKDNTKQGINYQKGDGYQVTAEKADGEDLHKWHFLSNVDKKLTAIFNIVCVDSRKVFRRSWLNHMNNYFLMALWLDDGSLSKGRQGVISLNSTPLAEAQIFAEYVTVVWGVNCHVATIETKKTKTNNDPSEVRISDFDNLQKWLRIIAPILPVRSMLYKVCLYTDDSAFVQRWISYLKSVLPIDWHHSIDLHYAAINASKSSDLED